MEKVKFDYGFGFKKSIVALPHRKPGDVGWDFYMPQDGLVMGRETRVFETGIVVEFPRRYFGEIHSRSSTMVKGVIIHGIIDPSYKGTIKLIVVNTSMVPFSWSAGDRIAQMVVKWSLADDDEYHDRGEDGLGSTGR